MFVCGIGEIVASLPYGCEFCLENCTVVWEFVRSLVYSSIVIVGGYDVAGSTACVGSGAVCVTGNTVAGKIINGVPELITVLRLHHRQIAVEPRGTFTDYVSMLLQARCLDDRVDALPENPPNP
jgi:hypothetical protein